jgi:UDP-N-acetylmuramyl pentapeptide synthase
MHHFAQDEESVLAAGIGIESHRLENAIGTLAFRLHCGAAVEAPKRDVGEHRRLLKRLQLRLTTEARNRLIAVKPDVF